MPAAFLLRRRAHAPLPPRGGFFGVRPPPQTPRGAAGGRRRRGRGSSCGGRAGWRAAWRGGGGGVGARGGGVEVRLPRVAAGAAARSQRGARNIVSERRGAPGGARPDAASTSYPERRAGDGERPGDGTPVVFAEHEPDAEGRSRRGAARLP